MRRLSFPSILAILFLLAGVAASILMVKYRQEYRLSASTSTAPKNVRVVNVEDASFTVTWTTDDMSTGFVKYGESKTLGKTALNSIIGSNSYTFFVDVKNLKPNNTYYFKINSDAIDYDNNGVEWMVKTGPTIVKDQANIISGTLVYPSKMPVENALVYAVTSGSSTISTYTSENGSYLLNLSQLRGQNLNQNIELDENESLLELSFQTGPFGTSSAKIFQKSAKPIPTITLGMSHDFRNLMPKEKYDLPTASFELPKVSSPESKTE